MMIGFIGQFDAVVLPGENLAEDAQSSPVVVVHHHTAHAPAPRTFRHHHLFGECNWQRPYRLDGEATHIIVPGVRFVEFLGESMGRWGLVHTHETRETPCHHIANLYHQVFADGATGVGKSVLETGTGRVQEQARGLDGVARDDDHFCPLLPLVSIGIKIGDACNSSILAHIDARDHGIGTYLCSVTNSVRNVADQRALFCTDLAALDTESAIDTVRSISVRAFINRYGTSGDDTNAEPRTSLDQNIADPSQRMRSVAIAVWLTPWIVSGT